MDKKSLIKEKSRLLAEKLDALSLDFNGYIYNPLSYAWDMHEKYLDLAVTENQKVFFLGMNPGPFGMCQTGVPFGDIGTVRDYLCMDGVVETPRVQCPKRPVEGLGIKRREISGRRLWGAVSSVFPPGVFFSFATVFNYCPLAFLDKDGRNVTPDRLCKDDREKVFGLCDGYLGYVLSLICPELCIGVGGFASERLSRYSDNVITFTHPSPLNRRSAEFYPEKAAQEIRRIYEDLCQREDKHRPGGRE